MKHNFAKQVIITLFLILYFKKVKHNFIPYSKLKRQKHKFVPQIVFRKLKHNFFPETVLK